MRFLLAALLACCAPVAADDFDRMAGKIARAAEKHSKKRVAVLPFRGIHNSIDPAGMIVSERLTGSIVDIGGLEVVERTLLQAVMKEQQLEVTGVVHPELVKQLGRVLGVEALVTGTVINLKDDRIEVNARLIDAESARVLIGSTARIKKEWSEPLGGFWNLTIPPLPSFEIVAPASAAEWEQKGETDCERARQAVDRLENSLVELKARYWASRLRQRDFSLSSLKRNPGSEIRDAETRRRFYGRLKELYEVYPALRISEEEVRRLNRTHDEIERLEKGC